MVVLQVLEEESKTILSIFLILHNILLHLTGGSNDFSSAVGYICAECLLVYKFAFIGAKFSDVGCNWVRSSSNEFSREVSLAKLPHLVVNHRIYVDRAIYSINLRTFIFILILINIKILWYYSFLKILILTQNLIR